jgi:nicotinamidase/pyrazinamidase
MAKLVSLLSIDPQNDFCIKDGPGGEKGQLVVAGADEDMKRLSKFVKKNKKRISEWNCTMDCHQTIQIFHPPYWIDNKGCNPPPFTLITADDVRNGVWRPFNPKWQGKSLQYVETLQKNGRYVLCIWPLHCLIGTWGQSLVPCVAESLYEWERDTYNRVCFVAKGSNIFCEHYSAVKAEVEDDTDPSTKLNTSLIDTLNEADEILITGEALSHCTANTVRDIAKEFGDDQVKKFTFLEDTSSNVTGFENLGQDFVKDIVKKGMKITNTKDW